MNRLEENLNNAQKEFINNLHHAQDADLQQASDRKTLLDDISQFFSDYDQKARLNRLESPERPQSQSLLSEVDKKSLDGDMAADIDVVDASYIFIEVDKK